MLRLIDEATPWLMMICCNIGERTSIRIYSDTNAWLIRTDEATFMWSDGIACALWLRRHFLWFDRMTRLCFIRYFEFDLLRWYRDASLVCRYSRCIALLFDRWLCFDRVRHQLQSQCISLDVESHELHLSICCKLHEVYDSYEYNIQIYHNHEITYCRRI